MHLHRLSGSDLVFIKDEDEEKSKKGDVAQKVKEGMENKVEKEEAEEEEEGEGGKQQQQQEQQQQAKAKRSLDIKDLNIDM